MTDLLGKKKLIVGWAFLVLGALGMIASFALKEDVQKDVPTALLVLIVGVLGYDVYITHSLRANKKTILKPLVAPIAFEDRQIISSEFHKLSPSWAQHLVLYRILAQSQCVAAGLANQLEHDGFQGAKEKAVDPVVASPLIRKLSDDRISILDDPTRQVLRQLFAENPLLPPLT